MKVSLFGTKTKYWHLALRWIQCKLRWNCVKCSSVNTAAAEKNILPELFVRALSWGPSAVSCVLIRSIHTIWITVAHPSFLDAHSLK